MRDCLKSLLVAAIATFCFAVWAINYGYAAPAHPESLVRIYTHDTDGERSYGSGAVLSSTRVLTNWHVIKDRRRGTRPIQVRFADGSRRWATVNDISKKWDLALLAIRPTDMKPIELGSRPHIGQVVTIQGVGPDYEPLAFDGPVASFMRPDEQTIAGDYVEVSDAVARTGDSGGPITDADGKLIGVLFGSNDGTHPDRPGLYTIGTTVDRIRKEFDLPHNKPNSYILRGTYGENN